VERGRTKEIEENEAQFGRDSGLNLETKKARVVELESELSSLRQEIATEENPNEANPGAGGLGGGLRDNTVVDGERPAGAPRDATDDYDDTEKWTKAKLSDELKRRNKEREENDLEPLRTTGNRSELVDALRLDDKELAEEG